MKKLALGMIVIVVSVMAWRAIRSDAPSDAPGAKLLFGRLWVDHLPSSPTDKFQALFVNHQRPFGNFATRTAWTGQWEGFHYHIAPREDGVIEFLFGATNERQRVRYKARPCNESGFDFCLELTGTSRGARRYFSKKEWQLTTGELDRADDILHALVDDPR